MHRAGTAETEHLIKPLSYAVFVIAVLAAGLGPALAGAAAGVSGAGQLMVLHLLTTSFLAAFLAHRSVKASLVFLAVLMPWQPFLSMPVAESLGSSGIKLLVATKEVYAAVLVSVLFLKNAKKVRWNLADLAGLVFLLVYFAYMVKSPAGLTSRIVSFKEGFMIACFYLGGRLSLFDMEDIVWFLKVVIGTSVLVAAFGYLERFAFDARAWRYYGAIDYLNSKIDTSQYGSVVLNGLPLNWYTYIGHTPVRRMVGPIGDATSLSRFLALPVMALIYVRGLAGSSPSTAHIRTALLVFIGAALALTLGRGGQLIVIGGLMVLAFAKRPLLSAMLGAPAVFFFLTKLELFDIGSGSALRHMAGLAKGVLSIAVAPLGNGLGSSGQMAVLYSAGVGEKVSESYIGSLAYQMGIPGVLAYTLFFAALMLKSLRTHLRLRKKGAELYGLSLMAFTFSSGIYFTSILANSAIAPISAGLSLVFIGAFQGAAEKLQLEEDSLK